jgi:hypothetical protein
MSSSELGRLEVFRDHCLRRFVRTDGTNERLLSEQDAVAAFAVKNLDSSERSPNKRSG